MHFLLLLNMWHFTLKFLSNFSRNLICIIHILSKYNFMISHCLIYPSPWLGSASHYICYLSARYTGEERGRTHIWPENSIYRSKCFSGISCSRISLISQYITFVLRKFTWLILVNVNTFVHFLIFFSCKKKQLLLSIDFQKVCEASILSHLQVNLICVAFFK